MKVVLVYLSVVLLWSTTPLAIKWSGDSFSFIAGVSLRMALAFAIIFVVLAFLRRSIFVKPEAWKVYAVASIGLFPAMPMVYWASQYISSGMIALVFAMTPISTGLASIFILRENPFTPPKLFGLVLAILGLAVVFSDQLSLYEHAGWAIAAALGASSLMGVSSVFLKNLPSEIGSLEKTAGALLFALPGLMLVWFFNAEPWPALVSSKSFWSILYLAIFGSLLGFTFYYYLLRHISPISLSLVTLMTPILALYLGHYLDAEPVSGNTIMGTAMIIFGLALYQGVSIRRLLKA